MSVAWINNDCGHCVFSYHAGDKWVCTENHWESIGDITESQKPCGLTAGRFFDADSEAEVISIMDQRQICKKIADRVESGIRVIRI